MRTLACLAFALFASVAVRAQQPVLSVGITHVDTVALPASVGQIFVSSGGTGYTSAPTVTLSAPQVGVNRATATATVSGGAVVGITIDNAGSGYTSAPTVSLVGGGASAAGAAAIAQLGGTVHNPPNESSGPAGVPINIFALATGTFPATGFTYTFFVNGISIGTPAAVNPQVENGISWIPPQPGTYFLTVKATDGFNEATSLPIRYFATGTVVNSPVTNTLVPVGSTVVLKADATAGQAFIKSIQFYDNGVAIGAPDTTIPFSLIYAVPGVAGSAHAITARATDNNDNVLAASSAVNLTVVTPIAPVPSSAISSPANNSAIAIPTGEATIPIAVDASSPTGLITKVELYLDGQLFGTDTTFPYTFDWKPTIIGTYRLVALSYDDKNNVVASNNATSTVVTIAAPPTVTITSPSNGTTVTGGSPLQIVAAASDSNAGGAITSVQFFVDGTFIGQDTTATNGTYSFLATLSPRTDPETGATLPSVITALATNAIGISTLSEGSSVTVTTGGSGGAVVIGNPPTGSVTAPAAGASLNVNTPVSITANASDTDGNITSVAFVVNGQTVGTDTVYPYNVTWTPTSLGTYAITIRATDSDGNVTTSSAVSTTVIDANPGSAPTVTITSPTTGSSYPVGSKVTVSASGTLGRGLFTGAEFFVNGVSIGTSSSLPFTASFTPAVAGTYTLVATGTDSSGTTASSSPVTITVVAGTAPTVAITSPQNGSNLLVNASQTVTASAAASSGSTIVGVEFFANGVSVGSKNTFPFTVSWTPTAIGTYAFKAVATDSLGASTTSSTVNFNVTAGSSPAVTLTNPSSTMVTNAGVPLTLTASASDTDGTVQTVEFFANGIKVGSTLTSAPYTTTFTPTAGGIYSMSVRATDNSGNITSSSAVLVVVNANVSPAVSITAPLAGSSIITNTAVAVTATATDSDGTIASVQFFANGVPIGSPDSSPPYTTQWTPTAEGTYRLTAMAIDNSGAVTTSSIVAVIVASTGGNATYTGIYQDLIGTPEIGRFAEVNLAGNTAVYIAHSTSGTPRVYFYRGIELGSDGSFDVPATATRPELSGQMLDSATSGTFRNGIFIGALTTGSSAVQPGFYSGSLTGNGSSEVAAIAGADGSIMLYVSTGSVVDAGNATMKADGSFKIVGVRGTTITGRINPATGLLSAALTGTITATAHGGIASAQAFSDGALRNLSTRGQVGTGADVLITGFVIGGNTPKNVLVRAVGPSMARLGIANPLARPQLQVYRGNGTPLAGAYNDRWSTSDAPKMASVGAFSLEGGTNDAAVSTVLNPGIYTTQVSGANGTTGVALIEFYDLDSIDAFSTQKVMNVSTRAKVGTGENVLIAGFVVSGTSAKKLLIRAVGPTLANLGIPADQVLNDPQIILRDVTNGSAIQIVRENDNWQVGNEAALVNAAGTRAGAFALPDGSRDAALLISLPPGSYTAEVSGVGGTTGVALVEVYEVP